MRIAMLSLAASFALSVSATCLASESQTTAAPQLVPASLATTSGDVEKKTCHHVVHEGMMTQVVLCLTEAQWQKRRQETQQGLVDIQRRSLTLPPVR